MQTCADLGIYVDDSEAAVGILARVAATPLVDGVYACVLVGLGSTPRGPCLAHHSAVMALQMRVAVTGPPLFSGAVACPLSSRSEGIRMAIFIP